MTISCIQWLTNESARNLFVNQCHSRDILHSKLRFMTLKSTVNFTILLKTWGQSPALKKTQTNVQGLIEQRKSSYLKKHRNSFGCSSIMPSQNQEF